VVARVMTDERPVVPNDHWDRIAPTPTEAPYWCVKPGGVVPRVHRSEHFVIFDPGLPRYRRCSRCGFTVYVLRGRG